MIRRTLTLVFCAACLVLGGLSVAGAQPQRKAPPAPRPAPKPKPATRPTGVKLYENKENQFSFRAPAAWTEGSASASIYALSIVTNDQAPNPPMFMVRVVEPETALADVDAAVESLKKGYAEHNKDVKFRDVQKTKLGGEDARVLTVEGVQGAGSVERSTIGLHDGKVFCCVLSASDAKSYQRALQPSETAVRSFKWLDQKAPPATTQSAPAQAAPAQPAPTQSAQPQAAQN
jgi:hypothetical protein